MKAFRPFAIGATAALLLLSSAPLGAQETAAPANSAANAVGPAQLRNFSLEGTVIRRSEEPAAPAQPAPERPRQRAPADAPAQGQQSPGQRQQAPSAAERQEAPRESAAAAEPEAPSGQPRPSEYPTGDLPPPSPADPLFSPAPVIPGAAELAADSDSEPLTGSALPEEGLPMLPWLLAVLLFGGAAAYFIRRQRSPLALAGPAGVSELVAPEPAPARPRPAPPPARGSAPAAKPVGLVTTSLPPALELQFAPARLVFAADSATIEFDLVVVNSGSGPARDLIMEVAMVNAGPDQDQLLAGFFDRPPAGTDNPVAVPPLKQVPFRSAVTMPRAQLRELLVGGRTVFVPIVALKARYRWGGGDEQLSSSFLVGRKTKGDKLAPFTLDQWPRTFSGLGARRLEPGVRS